MPKGGRKRNDAEYAKELQDAINRINKKPEARKNAGNSEAWQEYLQDVLGMSLTDNAQGFWENVRQGVAHEVTNEIATKHNARAYEYQTGHITYRSNTNGQFVSYQSLGLKTKAEIKREEYLNRPQPSRYDLKLAEVEETYRNEKTNQVSYRGVNGRFVKVVRHDAYGDEIE